MKEAEKKALEDFNNLKITVANPVTAIQKTILPIQTEQKPVNKSLDPAEKP